ncbi:MAG: nucleotidyltransferase [Gordonia amarae]
MSEVTARSVAEAVLKRVIPDEQARTAAARHRAEIEEWLTADLGIVRMRETGSWHHGTAITLGSDVDYFVTMRGSKPAASRDALEAVRASLARGLPGCTVLIDRPAVRIRYRDGGPAVEIAPAYYRQTDDYDIPDPDGLGWIRSNPALHLEYVNEAQRKTEGRAKGLIRLMKTWRTLNDVPLSSFYLEMRTAQYAASNSPILYDWDLRHLFKSLSDTGLPDMNDPTDYGRRVTTGARNEAEALRARLAVDDAARLTRLAREAAADDDDATASRHMLALFNLDK